MTDNLQLQWNDYSSFIKKTFGCRVQKISINAGLTCPNRDGRISTEACIYCTNESFSPFYCNPQLSITEQLQKGIDFFSPKYKTQSYFAYFQTFTNTYADIYTLEKYYKEALSVDNVIGIVIATRPDCINVEVLKLLSDISKDYYVTIEFGAESTKNETLKFINRGHSYEKVVESVCLTQKYDIPCGLHLILGLPYETEDDFYEHARKVSQLPIQNVKVHQMQVLRNTRLASLYAENPSIITDLSLDNYVRIISNFLELLNPNIIVERFTSESPKEMLIYPNWNGKKNFEISHIVNSYMKNNNMYQGKKFFLTDKKFMEKD